MTEAPFTAAQKRQWQASNPEASAWVVANAGAGKTHVLTQRVVRLLLDGNDPGAILCVTFTKAAAAEMANRIFGTLAGWALLNDEGLAAALTEVQGVAPSPAQLARARRLFARALETPGGLKIQTIHALCERLLQQFPFEANVPGQFEVLDDVAAAALIAQARAAVLAAARDETTRLGAAMRKLALTAADGAIDDALACFVARREAIAAWMTKAGGAHSRSRDEVDDAVADMRRRFGLPSSASSESVCREICSAAGWAASDCEGLCEALRQAVAAEGNRNDGNALTALERIVRAGEADLDGGADARIAFFLSRGDGGELRPRQANRRFGANFRAGAPGLDGHFEAEAARLVALAEQLAVARTVEATEALITVGDAILQRYREAKNRLGALDYDDLIVRTGNLLARSEAAQWVLYKLDAGLDHILVDEAQDTSPAQWAIVKALAGDFFAGETAAARPRTIFAVGDDKQSIFSFQGAVPRIVADMAAHFRRQAEGAQRRFETVPLGLSFRSTKEVLDAVDQVFTDQELSRSVTSGEYEEHTAHRAREPGQVVVWPRVVRPDIEEPEDWKTPLDAPAAAEIQLAREIAAEIGGMLGKLLPSGKILEPGGVLVLARKRGSFAAAMNRALKEAGLPTAGADRIAVADHIAVLDLLALGDVMLLPEDDLQLAACLKSPLFGLDDQDFMALAAGRGRASLWSRLAESSNERHRAALERLRAWQGRADRESPLRFYARILGPEGGRRAMRGRLGSEVDEVLDAFLSQAQAYERSGPPSLQGFLAAMRAVTSDLKREADEARAIRVMTVHGAKGLEADCVFLVDTGGQIAHASHRDPLVALPGSHAGETAAFFWRRGNSDATATQRELDRRADEAARDEYRRLLYVGMTRARDVLHVCGIKPKRPPEGCWYELVSQALVPEEVPRSEETGELAERFVWPPEQRPRLTPGEQKPEERDVAPIRPAWLDRPAPPPPAAPEPLRPSQALAEPDAPEPGTAPAALSSEAMAAMRRGLAVHRLLQHLPQVAPADRLAAAARLLTGEDADEAARDALAAEALAVLELPELAEAFGPAGRAEVPLVGLLQTSRGPFAVSGQIDRLVIAADTAGLIDFKTDRTVPARVEEVPPAYIRQLALYWALLRKIDPTRAVRAKLVWTAGPCVLELPAPALTAALDGLGIDCRGPA